MFPTSNKEDYFHLNLKSCHNQIRTAGTFGSFHYKDASFIQTGPRICSHDQNNKQLTPVLNVCTRTQLQKEEEEEESWCLFFAKWNRSQWRKDAGTTAITNYTSIHTSTSVFPFQNSNKVTRTTAGFSIARLGDMQARPRRHLCWKRLGTITAVDAEEQNENCSQPSQRLSGILIYSDDLFLLDGVCR